MAEKQPEVPAAREKLDGKEQRLRCRWKTSALAVGSRFDQWLTHCATAQIKSADMVNSTNR